jgi:hypothetical protein
VRRSWWGVFAAAVVLIAGVVTLMPAAMSADDNPYVGTWAGTWEGGGSGRFDLTIERDAAGALSGGVSVGTDQGDYVAKFKELSFDGGKMKAKYDFPLDAQAEVAISGAFAAADAQGQWQLQPQGQDQPFAGGTWTVKKK